MKKQTIAVDIDEVLSPLHDLVFAHHNEIYGTNFPLRDPAGSYFLQDYTGESHDMTMEKLKDFIKTEAFINVTPLVGAMDALSELKNRFEVIVVTSRQDFYYDITHKWLNNNFPQVFRSIHFTDYLGGTTLKVPKSKICIDNGAEYLIEDNIGIAKEVAQAGVEVLLFGDYPWNQTDKPLSSGVTRVLGWPEVLEYFTAKSDKPSARGRTSHK